MENRIGLEGQSSSCKIVKILGSQSNVHGVSKIAKARSTPRRIFWIILVVLAFITATFQIVSVVKKYVTYPVVEVVNKSRKTQVAFPALTLCNTNPTSMMKINQVILNNTDILAWFQFIQTANVGEIKTKLQSHQAFYENFPMVDIGHSFDDLVLSCRFNNADCGMQNFSRHFDGTTYFNCFTFTGSTNQMQAGIDHGLSLILSTGDRSPQQPGSYGIYDITNPSSYGLGIRAQIHSPDTPPIPIYQGFDVPSGYSLNVGLTASLHTTLPFPYGECSTSKNQTDKNAVIICLQQCQQDILIKKCGCKTSALPDAHNSNVPFCLNIKNWRSQPDLFQGKDEVHLEMIECKRQVMKEINNDRSYEDHCECYEPCMETSYDQSISMSYWPEEFYQFSLLETLSMKAKHSSELVKEAFDTLNSTLQKYTDYLSQGIEVEYDINDQIKLARASKIIRQNFMRLNVYFQDLRVTEYTQIPTYSMASLLSDIGSVMILWLGFSMLSFIEMFELIMVLIMHLFRSHLYILGNKSG
jgi:hypothetical protein